MPTRDITILVSHYNRPTLLAKALASIRNQTAPPAEILVLDDCSREDVRHEIRRFADIATIHENQHNLGVSESLNQGIRLIKTEWIAFLADDDLFLPNKLELQNKYLDEHPHCDILVSPVMVATKQAGIYEVWSFIGPRQLTLKDALVHTAILFQTSLMRRETYVALNGLSKPPLEDQDFGIRAIEAGFQMHAMGDPTVIYRYEEAGQLSRNWWSMFRAQMRLIHRFSRLYRREFGRLGAIQMYARQFKRYGLWRGRFLGRALWATGCAVQAFTGDPFTAWDRDVVTEVVETLPSTSLSSQEG